MRATAILFGVLAGLGLTTQLKAQQPGPQTAARPEPPQTPLLHVKLIGPNGMQVSFFRGAAKPQTYGLPCSIGLRPGYSYRFALTGVPGHQGEVFFPALDVHGSLLLGEGQRNVDFPAAIVFTAEDFFKAKTDVMLKKVVVLERPDTAIPVAARPDAPLEIHVQANRDPLIEARNKGAVLAILHMGERKFTAEEMASQSVPGTLLLPGEKVLGTPRHAPWLSWSCYKAFDPLVGAAHPSELTAIYDGGDVGLPAGVTRDGKVVGLDPSDTVAQYADSKGRRRLAVSNRVALCIPRFIIVQGETIIGSQVVLVGVGDTRVVNTQVTVNATQPVIGHTQNQLIEMLGSRSRASGTVQMLGTAITGRINGLEVIGALRGTHAIEGQCARPTAPEPADGPLHIIKWPDKCGGLVGDVVTFTLKYTNTGGQPISNIVVTDSLTNRLQYVPGTAKSDRDAVFTMQANDAGSLVLRWEFSGSLLPRESGIVTFQVKIR